MKALVKAWAEYDDWRMDNGSGAYVWGEHRFGTYSFLEEVLEDVDLGVDLSPDLRGGIWWNWRR